MVLDEHSAPLPGAHVRLAGTASGAVADGEGRFALPAVPGDRLPQVTASFVGYEMGAADAETGTVIVWLAPAVQHLEGVTIVYERPMAGGCGIGVPKMVSLEAWVPDPVHVGVAAPRAAELPMRSAAVPRRMCSAALERCAEDGSGR